MSYLPPDTSFNHKVETCSTCHYMDFMAHPRTGSRTGNVEFYICGNVFDEKNEVKLVDRCMGIPDWCPRLQNKENNNVISKSE